MKEKNLVIAAGYIGLVAALCVGVGEFLLHFDPAGRFESGYAFMQGIPASRTTAGQRAGESGDRDPARRQPKA